MRIVDTFIFNEYNLAFRNAYLKLILTKAYLMVIRDDTYKKVQKVENVGMKNLNLIVINYNFRYKKMLQCQKCQQWFHQECIRNPDVAQLLMGDRFYEFVCTLCTGTSEEIVKRLNIGWVDSLHLILFNLIVSNRKEHHDLETAIIPLLRKKLKFLQCPSSVLKSSRLGKYTGYF